MDFAVQAEHRVKIKENEKRNKVFDLAKELKRIWNMKMTVTIIIIGALGTTPKVLLRGLEKMEIGGRTEITQTTA